MSAPDLVLATSDVVIGLATGIPVAVLAAGAVVLGRLRRRAVVTPEAPTEEAPVTPEAPAEEA
ncbi:MAG: hypothetical protein M0032_11195, partial [Actinomycetota bacterium]|nr:hypothetical protein [Actinomycetota bacterium]